MREGVQVRLAVGACRFLGNLAPASTVEAAESFIQEVREHFPDATHHAFAYRLGAGYSLLERCSDAREPAGTAGPPLLQQLRGAGISDAVMGQGDRRDVPVVPRVASIDRTKGK